MVTGKGITGGLYPISLLRRVGATAPAGSSRTASRHISTGGGAELGCIVALKVLEICGRPEVRSMVHYISDLFGRGLRAIQSSSTPTSSSASARTASSWGWSSTTRRAPSP